MTHIDDYLLEQGCTPLNGQTAAEIKRLILTCPQDFRGNTMTISKKIIPSDVCFIYLVGLRQIYNVKDQPETRHLDTDRAIYWLMDPLTPKYNQRGPWFKSPAEHLYIPSKKFEKLLGQELCL